MRTVDIRKDQGRFGSTGHETSEQKKKDTGTKKPQII